MTQIFSSKISLFQIFTSEILCPTGYWVIRIPTCVINVMQLKVLGLHGFWSLVFQWFSSAFNIIVTPDPETALQGHSKKKKKLDCNTRTALIHGMMIAKRCFLKHWKSNSASKFEIWLRELISILHVERRRYELSGNVPKFFKIWKPVIEQMNDQWYPL